MTEDTKSQRHPSRGAVPYQAERYQKIGEIRDLIPRFKEFYYAKLEELPNYSKLKLIDDFNNTIAPQVFKPYPSQYRRWYRRWDEDILAKVAGAKMALTSPERKAVRVRDENNQMIVPTENELESGAKTLGGELMNDAMEMLKSDQMNEDLYDDEVLIKRRSYILNVFNYVMSAVSRKEALAIKRSQEKRETAGFLMDLIRRSTAGKITPDEMQLFRDSVAPQTQNYEQPVGHNS